MSIKLVVMKSGEQIIADIQEMVIEEKPVGYYLTKPCTVVMVPSEEGEILINGAKTSFDISLYPWIPLAKGDTVPVAIDWVITYVDPVDMLLEMYKTNVLNKPVNNHD